MNWHEADDGGSWRTWVDPTRVGKHPRVAPVRVGITAHLPGDEPELTRR